MDFDFAMILFISNPMRKEIKGLICLVLVQIVTQYFGYLYAIFDVYVYVTYLFFIITPNSLFPSLESSKSPQFFELLKSIFKTMSLSSSYFKILKYKYVNAETQK